MWGTKPPKAPEKKTIASVELTDKFIKGLKNYDLTLEEIRSGKWSYCGGNTGRHHNYWKLCCPNQELPEHMDRCVCDHPIEENCYITDGPTILVLGNCCIKKFIPKSGRTCQKCGEPHKNRKNNLCNRCRLTSCDWCYADIEHQYSVCYKCYILHKDD
jgi:hypothetical protein